MSPCLLAGALALTLPPDGAFTLSWTHSVEKVEWREDWRLEPDGLHLLRAAIKGSGAGMEPGPDARLEGDWWVWSPDMAPLQSLALAASGMTASPWRLCAGGQCQDLGAKPGAALVLQPCTG